MDINKVFLLGHAGKDMEIRAIASGKTVATFSLATSNGKNKPPEWHNIETWDPPEWLHITKGDLVLVEGRIKTDTWEKEGVKKYKTKIVGIAQKLGGGKASEDDVPF